MPVYEYICKSCGKKFDALVRSYSTPDRDVKCKYCNDNNAERLLSMKASLGSSSEVASPGGGCSAPAGSPFG